MIGSYGRGVVIAGSTQTFIIQQRACFCVATKHETAILERINPSVVVEKRRNAWRPFPLRPSDIGRRNLARASGPHGHDASRIVGVEPLRAVRIPFFSRWF